MPGLLLHSPAEIVRNLLVARGWAYGSSTTDWAKGPDGKTVKYSSSPSKAWPAFFAGEPDTPDSCITVYDTTGNRQGRLQHGEMQENQGIQVRVRSASQGAGYVKAQQLAIHLDENVLYANEVAIGSSLYAIYSINRSGNVLDIGKEGQLSNRRVFTINATVRVRQLA
jgi:hypothetical protein